MPATKQRDYYKILGVKKKSTLKDIKKSYRELARKFHPDTNQGSKKAEEKFKIISEAYETLRNKKKRKEYDQRSSYARRGPRTQWNDPGGNYGYGYGEQQRTRQQYQEPFTQTAEEQAPLDPDMPRAGFDLQFMIDVPFVTVALGGVVPYSYEKYVNCGDCEGTGEKDDTTCETCQGKRWVVSPVTLDVKIPPGVADQYTLCIQKEGGEGLNEAPPGDLFLKVQTQPHPPFKRVKENILVEAPIPASLAENGGPLKVQTLNSTKTIEVEEGTISGEEYRIPGEGAAIMWGKKRGDLIIKFIIEDE